MYGMLCKHVYPFIHNIHNMLIIPAHLVATLGSRIVQAILSLPSHRPEKDWFDLLIIQSIWLSFVHGVVWRCVCSISHGMACAWHGICIGMQWVFSVSSCLKWFDWRGLWMMTCLVNCLTNRQGSWHTSSRFTCSTPLLTTSMSLTETCLHHCVYIYMYMHIHVYIKIYEHG